MPGGGYFVNDEALHDFDKYALFTGYRDAAGGNGILVSDKLVQDFLKNPKNFHLLDGYTIDGNPKSPRKHSTYLGMILKI